MSFNAAAALALVQIVLGAIDNVWHHEITEHLPRRREARVELALHAAREVIYGALFFALAWHSWLGAWAMALGALLAAEIAITVADFLVEDATRRLPKLERTLHTLLAVNFGALLAALAPALVAWGGQPTAIVPADYGIWSWWLSACGAGVLAFAARNSLAAYRHFGRPTWQQTGLAAGQKRRPRRILITGATGFIGRRLTERLIANGDRIVVLSRSRERAQDLFGPLAEVVTDLAALDDRARIDAIVNLAGAPVAGGRWTRRRKQTLLDSRLGVTESLLTLCARLARKPKTWINASAVGYYGARDDDTELHEKSPAQDVFQSTLCRCWEQAAGAAEKLGVKVSVLRIGLVLGRDGGALAPLARSVRWGVGAVFGGTQWVSWIHIDDLVDLVSFVLDQETLGGPLNATAPEPVRHIELMSAIAARLGRRLRFKLNAGVLRAALGELATLFVDGQRVVPERATALGFRFKYPEVGAALDDALAVEARRRTPSTAPERRATRAAP